MARQKPVGSLRTASLLLSVMAFVFPISAWADTVDLAGEWRFRLDPDKAGLNQQWFKTTLADWVRLPGSTDENGYGNRNDKRVLDKLSRQFEYTGPAWYQREIEIPPSWDGKRISLFLERCHWESQAWLDEQPLGMRDSLCVPHVYELPGAIKAGKHTLTVRVDNTVKYNVGNVAHSITEETQTNWNGIIGRMELRATDRVYVADVQVYPDPQAGSARVKVAIANTCGHEVKGTISCAVSCRGMGQIAPVEQEVSVPGSSASIEIKLPMGGDSRTWDEFAPNLYSLNTTLAVRAGGTGGQAASGTQDAHTGGQAASGTKAGGDFKSQISNPEAFTDSVSTRFGMRKLAASGQRILLNGRSIFLRGTLECCIFPRTGYPPMDVREWARIFDIARSYGLNHMRFHSWCPPEAAFTAADEAGFLLHVEAPQWVHDIGKDAPRDEFVAHEVERILDTYGNHPSFGMLCMGNELGGDLKVLDRLVGSAKQRDSRHLYASATAWVFNPSDDYAIPHKCRGLHGPTTDKDFREIVAEYKVPCITHEMGQWTVYPNLAEMAKYRGVLKARNFEIIRDGLADHHMLDEAAAFTLATGKQMLALYKEEIESQLRTPNSSGFQLLDLHDFPGQGTALVGTLDAFWESKGLIEPAAFRRYCGPTVPLLRLPKRVYGTDEKLQAEVEVAHFGPADLADLGFVWTIRDESGAQRAQGSLPKRRVPTGERTALGRVEAGLASPRAAKLTVTVSMPGTSIANDWDLWVYPPGKPMAVPAGILVTTSWDEAAKAALAGGGKVLLLPDRGVLARSLRGSFLPPFWSPIWFKGNAQSMSILCDPKHPALARFPTDMYTNWQWQDLLDDSRSMVLDDLPPGFRPIVQVVDNFTRNHRLGNLFEAKVGPGRLVVCTLDLRKDLEKRPVARQMWDSLLSYMKDKAFAPSQDLDPKMLDGLFRPYVPAATSREAPDSLGEAVLRVKAAAKATGGNGKWSKAADEVSVQREGFDYRVGESSTWKDDVGTAWVSSRRCVVSVTSPKGFAGRVFVRLDDWNSKSRKADLTLNGRLIGELDAYNEGGRWVTIPLAAGDTADGGFELAAESTAGPNAMITEIIVSR